MKNRKISSEEAQKILIDWLKATTSEVEIVSGYDYGLFYVFCAMPRKYDPKDPPSDRLFSVENKTGLVKSFNPILVPARKRKMLFNKQVNKPS